MELHVLFPRNPGVSEEEDVPIHGTTNEEEARTYSEALDNIIFQMGVNVKDEKVNAIKEAIENYKEKIAARHVSEYGYSQHGSSPRFNQGQSWPVPVPTDGPNG